MSQLKTIFDLYTLAYRPGLQEHLSKELLFDMPHLGMDPPIILGATRATALIAADAVKAGHNRFIILGGKEVGDEDPRFTRLLEKSLEQAGLPLPSDPKMKEHEYAREVLRDHFGIAEGNIITRRGDNSKNLQENLELLGPAYSTLDSLEFYTLAATARRVIGTARKVFDTRHPVISAHNVYPTGINRNNWAEDSASSFYAVMEADKILSSGGPSKYERLGYCRPVHVSTEICRAEEYVRRNEERRSSLKSDGPA